MKFNLHEAIKTWRKSLHAHEGMEPGLIEELEGNLIDRIEDYQSQGMSEKEAFEKATSKSLHDVEEVADEYYKIRSPWKKTPPWKRRFDLLYLLPNYLKIAGRNIVRKTGYTAVNVMGLLVGLLTAAVVILFISYELSFDSFHSKSDQLYRVGRNLRSQQYSVLGFEDYFESTPDVQLKQINGLRDLPGVEDACQFFIFEAPVYINSDSKKVTIENVLTTNTEHSFFNMFDWNFIEGGLSESINRGVVLTESSAEKIYGTDWRSVDITAQLVTVEDSLYQVFGVIENVPGNSHYDFNLVLFKPKIEYWGSRAYLQLAAGADPARVTKEMNANMDKINSHLTGNELFGGNFLQPITSIHLNSDLLYEMKPPGEIRYLYVFGLIATIILIITVCNYSNLSIAMNAKRNREIGIRKVMGARRQGIAGQFLMEALLICLVITPVVLLLINVVLPAFNEFMAVELKNLFITDLGYFALLIGLVLAIGIIAGLYPAFYLSGRPIRSLFQSDAVKTSRGGFPLRKALITFQFILLIGLISGTYFINDQIAYIQDKDLGYKKSGILYVYLSSEDYKPFYQKLKSLSEVQYVGGGSELGLRPFNQTTYKLEGTDVVFDDAYQLYMDYESLLAYDVNSTIKSKLDDPEAPERMFIINQTAAEQLARVHDMEVIDLLGQTVVSEPEYTDDEGNVGFPVVVDGFFDDINLFSLREKIEPYFIYAYKSADWTSLAIISFETNEIGTFLSDVETAYSEVNSDSPFDYDFQEQRIAALYEQEQRVAQLTILLSSIALIIAVLGLIALTAYLTVSRKKEVGIRKTMGASVIEIMVRFNKEYIALIVIGLLVSAPLAFFGAQKWLSTFAFKISLSPFVFIGAALFTLLITIISVSGIAYNVANTNPAEALKDDQ